MSRVGECLFLVRYGIYLGILFFLGYGCIVLCYVMPDMMWLGV